MQLIFINKLKIVFKNLFFFYSLRVYKSTYVSLLKIRLCIRIKYFKINTWRYTRIKEYGTFLSHITCISNLEKLTISTQQLSESTENAHEKQN